MAASRAANMVIVLVTVAGNDNSAGGSSVNQPALYQAVAGRWIAPALAGPAWFWREPDLAGCARDDPAGATGDSVMGLGP